MNHLQFKLGLCEALLQGWEVRDPIPCELAPNERPVICTLSYPEIRRPCVVCHVGRPHFLCYKCGLKWMCLRKGCYEQWHTALHMQRHCRGHEALKPTNVKFFIQ